jgi:hypothetical protein
MNSKHLPIKYLSSVLVALALFGNLLLPLAANASAPADVLDAYTIAVTPQTDGLLTMDYTLSGYHNMSDWPTNQPYLQIGVPNSHFSITSWSSPDGSANISQVEAVNHNGSFAQFDFASLPQKGAVFNLHFTISQGQMAYPDAAKNEVTFKFIPAAWTFPINVRQLTVTWANPSDPALLKFVDPAPANGEVMTWGWTNPAINSSGMFGDDAINLAYDQSAFTLSADATATSNNGNGGGDSGLIATWVIVIIGIAVALFVGFFALLFYSDDYSNGSSTGGGARYYGGAVHSCACAGCACACACAGGGKVGCSRKAIGLACLPKVVQAMTEKRPSG